MQSGLYDMAVSHVRLHPQRHTLRMRITMLLLDLDELPTLARRLRFFSTHRGNLVSFHERDHGARAPGGLRAWVAQLLADAGIAPPGGAVRVLCMPRLLGRNFNPISIFFCHAPDGTLAALIYEVRNTFGQRHSYAVPIAADGPRLRHSAAKSFHVSPFMPMDMTYRFDLRRSADGALRVVIDGDDENHRLIRAVMAGTRREITDRTLLASALRTPLQGLQVLGRIHLEAVKLWWKGAQFHRAPAPPADRVTVGG